MKQKTLILLVLLILIAAIILFMMQPEEKQQTFAYEIPLGRKPQYRSRFTSYPPNLYPLVSRVF
jgi:hypothetical protein